MSNHNTLKICSIVISLGLLFLFVTPTEKVSARGGCFVGDTNILTPSGETLISKLKSGDSITSFNTSSREEDVSQINNVSVYKYNSYYLINGVTKVTSTHPFYVLRNGEFHIVEVK